MRISLLILIFACCQMNSYSQICYRTIATIDKKFKDTFSFHRQWGYAWDVIKDDNGSFSKATEGEVSAADTAHLYYTANCTTNVQGGYNIRYCFAERGDNEIVLTFSDGFPAYASQFRFHMVAGTFYFEPETIYPQRIQGEKISYRVDHEKLVLNKSHFQEGELMKGYVDVEFTEISTIPGKPVHERKYYLKGYFRTPFLGERKAGSN